MPSRQDLLPTVGIAGAGPLARTIRHQGRGTEEMQTLRTPGALR